VRGTRAWWVVLLAGLFQTAGAADLELGFGPSQPALNDTQQPWAVGTAWHLHYAQPLQPRWRLIAGLGYHRFLDDVTSRSSIRFVVPNPGAKINWRVVALNLGVEYLLATPRTTVPYLRAGLGSAFWRVEELGGDVLPVRDGSGVPTDFAANELTLRGALGLRYQISPLIGMALEAETAYLTGIGADFSDSTNSNRSRVMGTILLKLTFNVSSSPQSDDGRMTPVMPRGRPFPRPHAPEAAAAPLDADSDGIPDRLDRCPKTPVAAAGWVDVYGCAVDADADGVPDYRDRCPQSARISPVNEFGCVEDADGDGVPDPIDACAETPAGVVVDDRGCPAYTPLTEPRVFHFSYASGSARLDADAIRQLRAFAPTLRYNPHVKVRIHGYTDNVGPADANLALSQRRADEVKAFLVAEGISTAQLIAVGKGETNFVATNASSEGRAQNRRIEIIPVP
jgi:outer membrane protein OmpA-like peptidoglycan-associated protein